MVLFTLAPPCRHTFVATSVAAAPAAAAAADIVCMKFEHVEMHIYDQVKEGGKIYVRQALLHHIECLYKLSTTLLLQSVYFVNLCAAEKYEIDGNVYVRAYMDVCVCVHLCVIVILNSNICYVCVQHYFPWFENKFNHTMANFKDQKNALAVSIFFHRHSF